MRDDEEVEVQGSDDGEQGGEGLEPRGAQRRIDEGFREADRQKRQIQETASRLLEAAQRLEAQSKPKPPQAEGDKPPARDDFDSYEGYLEAKLDHQKREVEKIVSARVSSAVELYREYTDEAGIRARMTESARRGEASYQGFSDAIEKVPAMPQAALAAWQELPEPEHVAFYLGSHTEEAKKIGEMTPGRAAHAIIALGDRLDQERESKKSGGSSQEFGPKPGGKRADPSEIRDDMDMDSYAKARIQSKIKGLGFRN